MLPTLFVSHGAPTLPLTEAPAKRFLQQLPTRLPERPRAVLVVSAHWETDRPAVNAVLSNGTIHDFRGFQQELYGLRYPAPGSTEVAQQVADLLHLAGFPTSIDRERGLDHGAWVPLMLMFPNADVPVLQLSVQARGSTAHHLALGRALRRLRQQGILLLGSGSFTHDLSHFHAYRDALAEPEPIWVSAFADWFDQALAERRLDELVEYRRFAPFASRNHPTEEHLMPLFVVLGAAGDDWIAERLHASVTHGVLRMDVYSFREGRAQHPGIS